MWCATQRLARVARSGIGFLCGGTRELQTSVYEPRRALMVNFPYRDVNIVIGHDGDARNADENYSRTEQDEEVDIERSCTSEEEQEGQ